jgi:DNA-binding SARP family transcriptional activator/TolB-like protein
MLRIKCLGQLSVFDANGHAVAGAAAQPRRLAILALLARAGERGITREKVIGYLWPDSDEERARRLLSQAVYMLRRDLGSEEAIVGIRDLRLGTDVLTSDVAEFEHALAARDYSRAASVYAGPFLDGFYLPGAGEFERWVEEERRGLEHESDTAFEQCAKVAEARGDHATAVTWWRRMAGRDPINARIAMCLMRAMAAAGDRNGAIRHAAIHQALVGEELGLPADADVVRLAEEIREGSHAAAPAAQAAPVATTAAASSPVTEVPDVAALPNVSPAAHEGEAAARAREPTPIIPLAARPNRLRRFVVIASASVVGLIAVGIWAVRGRGADDPSPVIASRVVVAPLENRTSNRSLEPVGAMVAEWITQGLLRTGLVQVVDARTMLQTAREAGPSGGNDYLRTLADRTGAGTVVSGSYFVEGDSLRFLMRITEASSGEVRHTVDVVNAPLGRPTAALEPLRQRVTGALAVLLDPRLNNWTARTSQPPTYEAYGEFLLGMQTFGADYDNSVRHFTRAARLDSTYWQALLWAAMSYANLRRYQPADSLFQILDRNRVQLAAYDEANLDYFYAGFVRGDWETSYRGARRMLELAPGAAHAFFAAGLTAQITNRPGEAIDVLRRVDTREGWGKAWAPRIFNLIARSYHQLGDYQHDLEWARQLRASEPNAGWTRLAEVKATAALGRGRDALSLAVEGAAFPPTVQTWEDYSPGDFLWQAGRELRAHGHSSEAREAFQRAERWYASRPADERATLANRRGVARVLQALQHWADARGAYAALLAEDSLTVEHLGALGVLAARLDRTTEADSIGARLAADARPYTFGAPRVWAARIAAVKGEREAAVAFIHQALREGFARLYSLHADPDLETLRGVPAFQEILQPRGSGQMKRAQDGGR